MRTLSFNLPGSRPAHLLTVTRSDGTVIRVTPYHKQITISSVTWTPAVLTIGDITGTNDGALANLSFQIGTALNGLFDPYEINLGLFEDANALLEITNAANPVSKDFEFEGTLDGQADFDIAGNASFEILNKFGTPRDIFVRKYKVEDDVDFGDPRRSKVPTFPTIDSTSDDLADLARLETIAVGDRRRFRFAAAGHPSDYANVYLEATSITTGITGSGTPTPSSTVGSTYVDGGVTWTTRNAWARYAQVDTIIDTRHVTLTALPDPRASSNQWYAPGRLVMRSGFCKNRVSVTDAWDGTTFQLEMVEPFGELLQAGDWLEIAPDYDQTLDMLSSKYSDYVYNYRGLPHLTGARAATSTFIPGTTVASDIDPDFASTVLLLGFEGGSVFDESASAQGAPTVNGNAQVTTAAAKFGSYSAVFDGSGDDFSWAADADFDLGTVWTIEAFVMFNATTSDMCVIGQFTGAGQDGWMIRTQASSVIQFFIFDGFTFPVVLNSSASAFAISTWYHVCAESDGTTVRLYIDGEMVASQTPTTTAAGITSTPVKLGRDGLNSRSFAGRLDEVRISTIARYNSDDGFEVPTAPFARSA